MKQKGICWARVAKNIAYFIAPILAVALIASISVLAVIDTDIRLKEYNNYYETQIFSDRYLNSIYSNYHNVIIPTQYQIVVEEAKTSKSEAEKGNTPEEKKLNEEAKQEIEYYTSSYNNENFRYLIVDTKTNQIATNLEHTMKTDTIEGIRNELKQNKLYWNYQNGKVETNIENLKLEEIRYTYQFESIIREENIEIYTVLLDDMPYNDSYAMTKLGYEFAMKTSEMAPVVIPVSLVGLVICAIVILRGIGRTNKQEGIYLNWFDKWKLEIVVFIWLFVMAVGAIFVASIETGIRTFMITGVTIGFIIMYLGCVLMLETLVKRVKTHTVWKSTLLYSILHGIQELVDKRSITTKLFLYYWGFCALGLFLTGMIVNSEGSGFWILMLVAQGVLNFWYLFKKREEFEKIEIALKSIYEGNTNISLNANEMKGVLKELSIYIEDISKRFIKCSE